MVSRVDNVYMVDAVHRNQDTRYSMNPAKMIAESCRKRLADNPPADMVPYLEACARMWDWLSEHPGATKTDYFLTEPEDADLSSACLCACCTYVNKMFGQDCGHCPLKGYAWVYCLESGSPYERWGIEL